MMARTPHGSWRGCPHFGLRELLDQRQWKAERAVLALGEINRALEDLGITSVKAESVVCDASVADEIAWNVTLASTADRGRAYSVKWTNRSE